MKHQILFIIVFVVSILGIISMFYSKPMEYKIGNLNIDSKTMDKINDKFGSQQLLVCNMEDKGCAYFAAVKIDDKYQGPVPEGYDEEKFRQTGVTER